MTVTAEHRRRASGRLALLCVSLLAAWLVLIGSGCDEKEEKTDEKKERKVDPQTTPRGDDGDGDGSEPKPVHTSAKANGDGEAAGDDAASDSPRARQRNGDDGTDMASDPGPGPEPAPVPSDEERQAAAVSRMAYNAPKEMTQGEEELVAARITADPHEPLQENFPGPQPVQEKELPYSPGMSMCVELVGGGFDITPQPKGTDACHKQRIPTEGHVDWTWSVIPKQSGELVLTYEVYFFDDEGNRSTRASHNQREVIDVKISVRSWIDAHIVWLASAITALAGAFLALRKLVLVWRKKEDEDPAPAPENDDGNEAKAHADVDDATDLEQTKPRDDDTDRPEPVAPK